METAAIQNELKKMGFRKRRSGTCLTEYTKLNIMIHYWNDDIDRFWRFQTNGENSIWQTFTTIEEMQKLIK